MIAGVEIDRETRTFRLCGQIMPVGTLSHTPARPARPRADRRTAWPAELVAAVERATGPHVFEGMEPAMPEAIHVTLLCGENGWWIEVSIWPEYGDVWAVPAGGPFDDDQRSWTADDVLALWAETCRRTDPPPRDEFNDPFGGMAPGTWDWREVR